MKKIFFETLILLLGVYSKFKNRENIRQEKKYRIKKNIDFNSIRTIEEKNRKKEIWSDFDFSDSEF